MIRTAELVLVLAPLLLYVAWRRFAADGQLSPPRYALLVLLAGLAVIGAGLAWTGLRERHPEGSHYVPAEMRDGRIVPGHGA